MVSLDCILRSASSPTVPLLLFMLLWSGIVVVGICWIVELSFFLLHLKKTLKIYTDHVPCSLQESWLENPAVLKRRQKVTVIHLQPGSQGGSRLKRCWFAGGLFPMEPDFQNKLRIQKNGRTAPCHVGLYQNLTLLRLKRLWGIIVLKSGGFAITIWP